MDNRILVGKRNRFDLAHGKVINVRPEKVQHRFVNCRQSLAAMRNPVVRDADWNSSAPGAETFRDTLMALIQDWGTGLELPLYEESLTHFFGGEAAVDVDVAVSGKSGQIADQRMKLVAPNVAEAEEVVRPQNPSSGGGSDHGNGAADRR
jgi:hypothetical protein